jgi:hypothetical protein
MPRKPLTDQDPLPYGTKFRGKPMLKVPAWYLDYTDETISAKKRLGKEVSLDEESVLEYIERNRKVIDLELEGK